MDEIKETKPCPWCGELPYLEGWPGVMRHVTLWRVYHECNTDEEIRIETRYYGTKAEAIDAWNRRAE